MPYPARAIILAAGRGGRLAPETDERPKGLLSLGPETILEYQLRALRAFGIGEIAVVTGYRHERVREVLGGDVAYFHNELYDRTNSLYSLWLAAEFGREGCLICNSDVLFHPEMLRRLLDDPAPEAILLDRRPGLGEEEMKVVTRDGFVIEISKGIDPATAEGENVGLIKAGAEGAPLVFGIAEECARDGHWNLMAPHAVRALIGRRPFAAISTCGLPWIEIDFPQDLERARRDVYPVLAEALNGRRQAGDP